MKRLVDLGYKIHGIQTGEQIGKLAVITLVKGITHSKQYISLKTMTSI